jgi:hypothetical protein
MTKFEEILIKRGIILPYNIINNILDIAQETENIILYEEKLKYYPYAVFEDKEYGYRIGLIKDHPNKKVFIYCKSYDEAYNEWKKIHK